MEIYPAKNDTILSNIEINILTLCQSATDSDENFPSPQAPFQRRGLQTFPWLLIQ
jgi:hypothetical protein